MIALGARPAAPRPAQRPAGVPPPPPPNPNKPPVRPAKATGPGGFHRLAQVAAGLTVACAIAVVGLLWLMRGMS